MPNVLIDSRLQGCRVADKRPRPSLEQGDCIRLLNSGGLFQVIGIHANDNRCWVRSWPMPAKGSPVFEVSLQQIADRQDWKRQQPVTRQQPVHLQQPRT